MMNLNGGEDRIRTCESLSAQHTFQACALNQLGHLSMKSNYTLSWLVEFKLLQITVKDLAANVFKRLHCD